jgi:nucleotide-binding universal stress UspA family protein
MISLRTILVPYDFSTHSDAALRRAADLARISGARIQLLHAYALPVQGGVMPYDVTIPGGVLDAIREGVLERLQKVSDGLSKQGVPAAFEASELPPVEAITDAAAKHAADLIVVGTRGLTGLKHVVLGSVAERVVRHAPCPVLAVKEGGPGGAPRRILIATDFSDPADHARDVGVELAKQFGAEVHLVHAFDVPLVLVTPYDVAVPDGLIRDAREAAKKKLGAAAEAIRAEGLEATPHLVEVPAAPAIAEVAAQVKADIVVVGTHGRTGLKHVLLGSVAERTLRLAPCAVLAVKHEDAQLHD